MVAGCETSGLAVVNFRAGSAAESSLLRPFRAFFLCNPYQTFHVWLRSHNGSAVFFWIFRISTVRLHTNLKKESFCVSMSAFTICFRLSTQKRERSLKKLIKRVGEQ